MASASEVIVTFGGGKRVDAHVNGHVIHTDQPIEGGGEDSAPSPYSLFLASLATCAGFYVLRFCEGRGLSTEGIRIVERSERDPETKTLTHVELTVETPESFPAKYRDAIARAVDGCSVKKAIRAQPEISCRVVATCTESAALPVSSESPVVVNA
jgi:ribosomal protein S12 methylthiotransferase accessory factor